MRQEIDVIEVGYNSRKDKLVFKSLYALVDENIAADEDKPSWICEKRPMLSRLRLRLRDLAKTTDKYEIELIAEAVAMLIDNLVGEGE